jgi:hypothetical protein
MHGGMLLRTATGLSRLTGNPGGAAHAELLIFLVPVCLRSYPDVAKKLVEQLKKIEALAKRRNEMVHAAWNANVDTVRGRSDVRPSARDERTSAFIIRNRGKSYDSLHYTVADIDALAKEISDVRIAINRLIRPFPQPLGFAFNPNIRDFRLPWDRPTKPKKKKSD